MEIKKNFQIIDPGLRSVDPVPAPVNNKPAINLDILVKQRSGNALSVTADSEILLPRKNSQQMQADHTTMQAFEAISIDSLPKKKSEYADAEKSFRLLNKIESPSLFINVPGPSLAGRENKVEWVKQVSRDSQSKGTGTSALGINTVLSLIENKNQGPGINVEKAGVQSANALSHSIKALEAHIEQAGEWRSLLDQITIIKSTQGSNLIDHESHDVFLSHISMNILQVLKAKSSVLFPVDFQVNAPGYANKGGGHATLMFMEKKEGNKCDLHYFETGGVNGKTIALDKLKIIADSRNQKWSECRFSPDDIEIKACQAHDATGTLLRFSEFLISDVPTELVNLSFVKSLLARFSVVDPPVATKSELDSAISSERRSILKSLFDDLGQLGTVTIPPQQLQFSQRGGECEHASFMAFMAFYLGRNDLKTANNVTEQFHEICLDVSSTLVSMTKNEADLAAIKITQEEEKFRQKSRTLMGPSLVKEKERSVAELKIIKQYEIQMKNDVRDLQKASQSIAELNAMLTS